MDTKIRECACRVCEQSCFRVLNKLPSTHINIPFSHPNILSSIDIRIHILVTARYACLLHGICELALAFPPLYEWKGKKIQTGQRARSPS